MDTPRLREILSPENFPPCDPVAAGARTELEAVTALELELTNRLNAAEVRAADLDLKLARESEAAKVQIEAIQARAVDLRLLLRAFTLDHVIEWSISRQEGEPRHLVMYLDGEDDAVVVEVQSGSPVGLLSADARAALRRELGP